jgi:DNA-binding SARP family transcriptional activator
VRFGLLGPLEVTHGRRPVPMRSARQRVLLAALLPRAGELVTVDELAEAVWGDALPANPRRAVHTYVSRLRKLLSSGGARLIESWPDGYAGAGTLARRTADRCALGDAPP